MGTPTHDCDAMMILVCTDRGQHHVRVIEVLERAGGPGGDWSEQFSGAKAAYEATLSELLNLGAVPDSKLIERTINRDGKVERKLESRHRGGVRDTRHGAEVVCPKCHQRYPFRGAGFYRGLDAAVELGEERVDVSYLRRG